MESQYKQLIINQIREIKQSPSHDIYHVELVLNYANQLQEEYGGDVDVLCASVLLHDLGRKDPGKDDIESVLSSIELAVPILEGVNFPSEKIDNVLQAIEDHDKPKFIPRSIEGKILKDADFLAGFGAWGILRTAMWSGETGGGIDGFFELINEHMPRRIDGLEFNQSKLTAHKQYIFVKLFSNMLHQTPELLRPFPGKYIIFEGNGGVGKTTQANLLLEKLKKEEIIATKVQEPSPIFRMIENLWEEKYKVTLSDDGSLFRRYLIVGDRDKTIEELVLPALRDGQIVISDRSFISMLVYQCDNEFDRLFTSFVHSFQPTPDLIIIYDTDETKCYERMKIRNHIGPFDTLKELEKYRPIFLDIANSNYLGCPVEIVDASGTIDDVANKTWKIITDKLLTNRTNE